jgi:hypothetical protein
VGNHLENGNRNVPTLVPTLKMATEMLAETLVNTKYSTRLSPKSRSYTICLTTSKHVLNNNIGESCCECKMLVQHRLTQLFIFIEICTSKMTCFGAYCSIFRSCVVGAYCSIIRWVAMLIALMMEAARTSETLVNFYQTTRCYNPEDSNLRI